MSCRRAAGITSERDKILDEAVLVDYFPARALFIALSGEAIQPRLSFSSKERLVQYLFYMAMRGKARHNLDGSDKKFKRPRPLTIHLSSCIIINNIYQRPPAVVRLYNSIQNCSTRIIPCDERHTLTMSNLLHSPIISNMEIHTISISPITHPRLVKPSRTHRSGL